MKTTPDIWTIGHSDRTLEFLVSLLLGNGIQQLIDVRTFPRSRHNPQFNAEVLKAMLPQVGIRYTWMKALGGKRRPQKVSPNSGWRNASFRGYADHMLTAQFGKGLDRLIRYGSEERVAIMCAEAVPWRCHRSLIADALTVRKIPPMHIMSRVSAYRHQLTPWAKVRGRSLVYPESSPIFSQVP